MRALAVVEPLPIVIAEPSTVLQPLVISPELIETMRTRIDGQLVDLAPDRRAWNLEVAHGRAGEVIAERAREIDAQLIVLGLVHHGVMDRLLDGETVVEVIRHSTVPVLLSSPDLEGLPKRALVAADFSAESMEAARSCLRIMDLGGLLILAHAMPMATVYDRSGLWEEEYDRIATRELETFAAALEMPQGMNLQILTRRGPPARTLLDIAEKNDVDLIVAGKRGAGLVHRMLVGSVVTRLIHNAMCSLLIAPAEAHKSE